MMRLNFPDRYKRARHRSVLRVVSAMMVAVLVAILLTAFASQSARAPLHALARPLWSAKATASQAAASALSAFKARSRLESENDRLKRELSALQIDMLEKELLAIENQKLHEMWNRRTFDDTVLGKVLVRPDTSPYDALVIDAGRERGVREGNYVSADGVVMGLVAQVHERTAVVELFSSPGKHIDILIGASSTPVSAEGQGAGMFRTQLPRDIPVEEGDMVTLPLYGTRVFAVVEGVSVEASDPFQTIFFRNPVGLNALEWVEVLTDRSNEIAPASSGI